MRNTIKSILVSIAVFCFSFRCYSQQQDYLCAFDDCNQAIALNPDDPSYYYIRGWIEAELFDFNTAAKFSGNQPAELNNCK